MPAIRSFAKSCAVLLLGQESKPRNIVRGLAAGYQMSVSPAENLGYLLGTYEPHLQKIIKEYVAKGETVYDVGANVGYVSLLLAKRVGPSGRIVAFEPVPQNIDSFRENIKLNRLGNVELFECAASDKSGYAVIRIAESLSTASLVWHRKHHPSTELVIRTVSVDELVESGDVALPTFVKIDVEGAEGGVLLGMRRTVAAARPVLFVECSEASRETVWYLLRELGYRCQSAISRQWVDRFEDYYHSDFLWLPGHRG